MTREVPLRSNLLIPISLVFVASLFAACANTSPVQNTTGTGGDGQGGSGAGTPSSSSSGTGGASTGSTSSSSGSTGGASSSSSSGGMDDPCVGHTDGSYCGGDLGGLADHSSQYTCSGGHTTTVTPCPYGCSNGACDSPPQDPCASAQAGNGAYCGSGLSGGDPDALYTCQNGSTANKVNCPNGCKVNPPGVPDACNPVGGGMCCVNEPPGIITQAYSACGNGGVHYGMDYGTPVGTPIYAGISGTVVGSALGFPNCYNNGCTQQCWNSFNYVKVKSDCGDPMNGAKDLFVYYLHINDLAPGVGNGTHVDQGQLLAYSGNSGCSSGPHIHIETVSVNAGSSASLSTCSSVNPASRYCN